MKDIDYGYVKLKLQDKMKEENISINKLSFRAEMQRTQLKSYMHENMQRIDLSVLARLCYVFDCEVCDLLEYIKPEDLE